MRSSCAHIIVATTESSFGSPVSKRITADIEDGQGKKFTAAKGAPNAILRLTNFDKDLVSRYREQASAFAARGFRSLGVAIKEEGKDWELLGLLCMSDPPRHDTPATVREAQECVVCPV